MYGTSCRLPIHLELPVHQLLQDINNDQEALDSRIDQLVELDESRREAFQQIVTQQGKTKEQFDLHARDREFKVGDIVLLWDKRYEKPGKHAKFDSLWLGPYVVSRIAGKNSCYLSTFEGEELPLPTNGRLLKIYYPPVP